MILFLSLILILVRLPSSEAQEVFSKRSILELSRQADLACMDLKVIGICPKLGRKPPIGMKVRYRHPEVFMETVKAPGDSAILEYEVLLEPLGRKAAEISLRSCSKVDNLVISSGSSTTSPEGGNLRFNEAHILDFPWGALFKSALCSGDINKTLGIRYLSEADAVAWRDQALESKLPQSIAASRSGAYCHALPLGGYPQCMRSWGPLYPRTGFMIHPNEAVSSVVSGLRSLNIASDGRLTHVVQAPLDFKPDLADDRVQMVHPFRSACFPVGTDARDWQVPHHSAEGRYVWIYWHERQCCL